MQSATDASSASEPIPKLPYQADGYLLHEREVWAIKVIGACLLKPSYQIVLGVLVRRADKDTLESWPGIPSICADTNLSPRHVKRILRDLEKWGVIKARRRQRQTNVYTLLLAAPKPEKKPNLDVPSEPLDVPSEPLDVPPASPKQFIEQFSLKQGNGFTKNKEKAKARPLADALRDLAARCHLPYQKQEAPEETTRRELCIARAKAERRGDQEEVNRLWAKLKAFDQQQGERS